MRSLPPVIRGVFLLRLSLKSLYYIVYYIVYHGKETRNATNSLKMPKIRTEYARKSFYYTGAKIYNELPLKIRKITNATAYENSLKDHFS